MYLRLFARYRLSIGFEDPNRRIPPYIEARSLSRRMTDGFSVIEIWLFLTYGNVPDSHKKKIFKLIF
ncbi:hypothetical protein Aoki45_02690 [Algoriphagus sp. oki45]|nr:hypothetical protein Aoki45_02690 [Algoriphagus sp. oki45]